MLKPVGTDSKGKTNNTTKRAWTLMSCLDHYPTPKWECCDLHGAGQNVVYRQNLPLVNLGALAEQRERKGGSDLPPTVSTTGNLLLRCKRKDESLFHWRWQHQRCCCSVVSSARRTSCSLLSGQQISAVRVNCVDSSQGERTMASSAKSSRDSPYLDPEVIQFLENFQTLVMKEVLQSSTDRKSKVLEFQQPHDLEKLLDMEIRKEPESRDRMLQHCEQVIRYSVKTGHPRFFNQLYSGLEPYSLAGSWLTDSLNTNLHTYEVAPVFVVLEKYMMAKLCEKMGFPDGEGIFCPGGSFANIMAVHLARYRNNPDIASKGLWGMPKLRLYTSEGGHYSLKKSSMFLGIGTDHVVAIATDDGGRLRADVLERQMEEDRAKGYIPLIVMATSGTTVLGSYDRLKDIAHVCQKHRVWMHVDCAWGGGVLLTEKYKHLMAGVERADSVTWNLHKMCHVTVQASALMVKEKGLLQKANGLNAEYLFQPEKPYDTSYDIGDRSMQCGRKVDVLKVWMTWKGLGEKGLGEYVERSFENAEYLTEQLRSREGFRLVLPEFECTNICFWYIPPCMRGQEENGDWWSKLGKVAPIIKKRMMMEGTMMIGYQPLTAKNVVNFFRVIVANSMCDHSDMDFIVDEVERLGKDITTQDLA